MPKNIFAGITDAFWEKLGEIEKLTGIKRESIALSLFRLNQARGRKWEADLWKSLQSRDDLEMWIAENLEYAHYDEEALLEIAKSLPIWARRSLIEVARALPSPHGGKPRALNFQERQEVKRHFAKLTTGRKRRIPNYKAYQQIKAWLKAHRRKNVSLHTIRIICDPKEQSRRTKKQKRISFVAV